MKKLAVILALAAAALGAGAVSHPAPAQDARWNALYDRIIRLEHEVRAMRGVSSGGGGAVDARLRALQAEVNDLRRQIGARMNSFDRRLRKLEGGRASARAMPPPRAPRRPVRGGSPAPAPGAADMYEPSRPEVTVEIDPPRDQVLGRLRTDGRGAALPPRTGAGRASAVPRAPSGGARALPGVPAPGDMASAPVMPGAVQAAPLDSPSGAGAKAAAVTGGAKALLKRARDSFLARRFGLAEASYRTFLSQYGHDPKAPQAQFELGETYYVQGRYKPAGQAYLKTYKTWPKSSVAPQALLRLGMSLNRLGLKKKACAVWKQLRQRHPGSRAARTGAPREMKRARCRG